MGADVFFTRATGSDANAAFASEVDDASYESGHGGYTGTIAEKHSFVLIAVPDTFEASQPDVDARARRYAESLIEASDPRVNDKWGPAGCIAVKPGTFLFFGWASS